VVSLLIPTYLFFVPVQNYINSATHKLDPVQPYREWSLGHVVCLVLGLTLWGLTIWGAQLDALTVDVDSGQLP
jgi:hypothetical protein